MSIPREAGLRKTAEGIRLVQQPVRELETLRDRHSKFRGGNLAAGNAWLAKSKMEGDQLELVAEFEPATAGVQGIKVLQSDKEATVIGVDRDHGRVFVDRTQSGNVSFHPKFSGVYDAPLAVRDAQVKLHIFVDACSVEVFVNDGDRVFTVLAYPSADSRGVQFFGPEADTKLGAVEAWTLKSVWK